jgi:hypothetical protein
MSNYVSYLLGFGSGTSNTYLLRQSFTASDSGALTDGNTITGPGEGGTVASTDASDTGTLTVVDTAAGSVEVLSNKLRIIGTTDNFVQLVHSGQLAVRSTAGMVAKHSVAFERDSVLTDIAALSSHTAIDPVAANRDTYLALYSHTDDQLLYADYNPAGTSTGNVLVLGGLPAITAATTYKLATVFGGFSSGTPSASGTEGALHFFHDGTNWNLIGIASESSNNNLYIATPFYSNLSKYADFDDIRIPDSTTTMESTFTATGYVLDTSVSASDTFTHIADQCIAFKITTLPSAGNIDIGIRTDWAIRVESGGTVRLIEDYDGAKTVRATSGNTAVAGDIVMLRQVGSANELWVDSNGKASYTSATNLTDTGGDVHSLGTGGAVAWIYSLPIQSATYAGLDTF